MALAPRGVPVTCAFFASDPQAKDFEDVPKVKTLDVHPSKPWVLAADERGRVTLWDYARNTSVLSFSVDELKAQQAALVVAAESQATAAGSAGVAGGAVSSVPARLSYLGLGTGLTAAVGGGPGSIESRLETANVIANAMQVAASLPPPPGTSASSASTAAARAKAFRARLPHLFSPFPAKSNGAADIPADFLAGSAGDVRAVAFADAKEAAGDAVSEPAAPHWLVVLCEHRTLLVDYVTLGVTDIPHASLSNEIELAPTPAGLVPARRGPGLLSGASKPPSVRCVVPLGGHTLAFGCEDGVLRVWHAGFDGVVQATRIGEGAKDAASSSGKAITALAVVNTDAGWRSAMPDSVTCKATSSSGALGCLVAGTSDGWVRGWPLLERGVSGHEGRASLVVSLSTALTPMRVAAAGAAGVAPVSLQPLPPLHLKGCGGIHDLTACPLSGKVVVKTEDKLIVTLQVTTAGATPDHVPGVLAAAPLLAGKVSTASDASETGAGSAMQAALPLGAHPAFPPQAVLVASKGPHIEVAIPGLALQVPGAGGAPAGGAPAAAGTLAAPTDTTAALLYDLRSARPGLPKKCKVYTLRRHPLRPELAVAGTNIGVFVMEIAGGPAAAAPAVLPLPLPPAAAAAGGARVLHLTASSSLLVTDLLPRAATDLVPAGVECRSRLLAPAITPVRQPPASLGPSPANPGPPNPWAALAASVKGVTGSNITSAGAAPWLPGTRGARLGVSASGRYLSVVWPEHKCYAIYRITAPALGEAEPGAAASAGPAWYVEYVDGGAGGDVAWAPAGSAAQEPSSAEGEEEARGDASPAVDRYALLVPGAVVAAGRGPMGGGMPIGTSAAAAAKSSGQKGKGEGAQGYVSLPPALSIRELDVTSADGGAAGGSDAPLPKPRIVAPDVALPGDAIAVWGGGPCLAVAVGPEAGLTAVSAAAATTTPTPQALAAAQLLFYPWTVLPPLAAPAEGGSAPTAPHVGMKRKLDGLHRLGTEAGTASSPLSQPLGPPLPAPSWHSVSAGANSVTGGVVWDGQHRRVAVACPGLLTVLAPPVLTPGASSNGWAVVAQLPLHAAAVAWVAPGVLAVTRAPVSGTYAGGFEAADGVPSRHLIFLPPLSTTAAAAAPAARVRPIEVALPSASPASVYGCVSSVVTSVAGSSFLLAGWRGAGVAASVEASPSSTTSLCGGAVLAVVPGLHTPRLRALAALAGDAGAGLSGPAVLAALTGDADLSSALTGLPSEVSGVLTAFEGLWGPGSALSLLSTSSYARTSLVAAAALLSGPVHSSEEDEQQQATTVAATDLFDLTCLGARAAVLLCGLRRYRSVMGTRPVVLANAAAAVAACSAASGGAAGSRVAVDAALACAALYEAFTAIPSEVPGLVHGSGCWDGGAGASLSALTTSLMGEGAGVVAACAAAAMKSSAASTVADTLRGVGQAFLHA